MAVAVTVAAHLVMVLLAGVTLLAWLAAAAAVLTPAQRRELGDATQSQAK